jgi:hypothetical protein
MRTSIKVGGYTLGLAAIFAAALGVGGMVGPHRQPPAAGHDSGRPANPATPATAGPASGQSGGHDTGHSHTTEHLVQPDRGAQYR